MGRVARTEGSPYTQGLSQEGTCRELGNGSWEMLIAPAVQTVDQALEIPKLALEPCGRKAGSDDNPACSSCLCWERHTLCFIKGRESFQLAQKHAKCYHAMLPARESCAEPPGSCGSAPLLLLVGLCYASSSQSRGGQRSSSLQRESVLQAAGSASLPQLRGAGFYMPPKTLRHSRSHANPQQNPHRQR